jgi:hypothetical protein
MNMKINLCQVLFMNTNMFKVRGYAQVEGHFWGAKKEQRANR